jgi:hypothetical protein
LKQAAVELLVPCGVIPDSISEAECAAGHQQVFVVGETGGSSPVGMAGASSE